MATYIEIKGLFGGTALKDRVAVACIIAAETIRNEDVGITNHANRLLWAKSAFSSPSNVSSKMLMALLAINKDLTVEQIQNASDSAIQSGVESAINLFATGD